MRTGPHVTSLGAEIEALRGIVRSHFPESNPTKGQLVPLTRAYIADPDNSQVVEKVDQESQLSRLAKHVRGLADALNNLHPSVARELEHCFARNADRNAGVRFFTEDDVPYPCTSQIELLADYLITGLRDGGTSSAFSHAKAVARSIPRASKQQVTAQTWMKVRLVHSASSLWDRLGGGPAPRQPSGGAPFHRLVGELIDFHDFHWNVDATFRAYRKATEPSH